MTSEAVIRPHNGLKDQNTALRSCINIGYSGKVIIAITTTTCSYGQIDLAMPQVK